MPAPSPPPDDNDRAFSPAELAVARRAYARQMTASLGVDNPAIEAAYAAAPLEAFLGPPPWTASSPFTGYRPLSGSDPVGLYQDHSHRPRPGARGQQPARRCAPSSSRPSARSPASASSMSAPARAIIARSRPSWSTPPARSRPSSSTRRWPSGPRPFPAVRTFGLSVTTAPVAGNPGRPGSRQFCRGAAGRLLDRRPVSGRPARLPARCAWPPAAELRRPAQRPRRGALDLTAQRRLRGARYQRGLFCLRRGRIRG
jgi:hypothetical protein